MKPKRNTTIRDKHRRIISQNEPPCWICGQPIDYTLKYPDPKSFVVDHRTALAQGGTDTLENKAASHNECNRNKSDREYADIIKRSGSIKRPGK